MQPLEINGVGNHEFNTFHESFVGYDFAYRLLSCYRVREPVGLELLRDRYGLGGAPRGMIYVPDKLAGEVKWSDQELLWTDVADRNS